MSIRNVASFLGVLLVSLLLVFVLMVRFSPQLDILGFGRETVVLHPDHEQTIMLTVGSEVSVVAIRIKGKISGSAELRIQPLNVSLHLPQDLNRKFLFDWYGSVPLVMDYFPGDNVTGSLGVQFKSYKNRVWNE